jgi:hypothetical protein
VGEGKDDCREMTLRLLWWFWILGSGFLTYILSRCVIGYVTDPTCTECGQGAWIALAFDAPFLVGIMTFQLAREMRAFRLERVSGFAILAVGAIVTATFLFVLRA